MTLLDTIIVAMAGLQIIAVGLMIYAGVKAVETAKRAQQMLNPALQEVKTLAATGKAVAEHAREDGTHIFKRVKEVGDKVRRRVKTTQRLLKELKPQAHAATTEVKRTKSDVASTTHTLRDLAARAERVRNAVRAATAAARNGAQR